MNNFDRLAVYMILILQILMTYVIIRIATQTAVMEVILRALMK